MVRHLEQTGGLRSASVRKAFLDVPREAFVSEVATSRGLDAVYNSTDALITKTDSQGMAISSSSAASIMAPMLEQLDVQAGHRVLEIGAGTGYNAALLDTIVGPSGRVCSVDIDGDTARRARAALRARGHRVTVHHGDGRKGWPKRGLFDRIIVTASADDVPRAWFAQLREGGLLQLPLRLVTGTFGPQIVVTLRKEERRLVTASLVPGGFMTMRAQDGADAMQFGRVNVFVRGNGRASSVNIDGAAIDRLSDAARRRTVGVIAEKPLVRTMWRGDTERAGGLLLYAALGRDTRGRIEGTSWWSSGVVDRAGAGLAVLAHRGMLFGPGARGAVNLYSFGARGPTRQLTRLVDAWRAAGRPRWQDLRITVSFRSAHPHAWRSSQRGASRLSFDWAPS
jgi:protein-L-isoaspartate(D-aspartate) O-methyltransferase